MNRLVEFVFASYYADAIAANDGSVAATELVCDELSTAELVIENDERIRFIALGLSSPRSIGPSAYSKIFDEIAIAKAIAHLTQDLATLGRIGREIESGIDMVMALAELGIAPRSTRLSNAYAKRYPNCPIANLIRSVETR